MGLSGLNSGHLVRTCFFHWLGFPASCCHLRQTCPTIHSEISSRKENIIRRTETRQIGWTITELLLVILACKKQCYPKCIKWHRGLAISFWHGRLRKFSPPPPPPLPAQLPTVPQEKNSTRLCQNKTNHAQWNKAKTSGWFLLLPWRSRY